MSRSLLQAQPAPSPRGVSRGDPNRSSIEGGIFGRGRLAVPNQRLDMPAEMGAQPVQLGGRGGVRNRNISSVPNGIFG